MVYVMMETHVSERLMSVVFVTVLELSTTVDVLVSLRGSAIVKAHLI
jgi:hypothetical protein